MVHCSACGKPIDKVPDWLSVAKVEFICNNCPNRQMKNIAAISLELDSAPTARLAEDEVDAEEITTDEVKD